MQKTRFTIGGEEHRLVDMLDFLAAPGHEEIMMVSPYVIPLKGFLEDLKELSDDGAGKRLEGIPQRGE